MPEWRGRQNEKSSIQLIGKSEMDGNAIYHFTKIKHFKIWKLALHTRASEIGGNDWKKRKWNSADNFFFVIERKCYDVHGWMTIQAIWSTTFFRRRPHLKYYQFEIINNNLVVLLLYVILISCADNFRVILYWFIFLYFFQVRQQNW